MTAPSASRNRLLIVVLGALVVVSAVLVGLLGWQVVGDSHADAQRAAALDAARSGAKTVLSFDPAGVNAELAAARKVVSGQFATQFDQLADGVILPGTQKIGLATKGEVTRAAVIDAQPEQVDVLLFVRQTTSTRDQPQTQAVTNQVRVTMTKSDNGQWLISSMLPL